MIYLHIYYLIPISDLNTNDNGIITINIEVIINNTVVISYNQFKVTGTCPTIEQAIS